MAEGQKGNAYECYEDTKASGASESIVSKVSNYFFGDPTFSKKLEDWVKANAASIDLSVEEFQLNYTDLYNDFKELYESLLEDYIRAQGYSITTFYKELREASDQDPDGCEAILGQIVLAASDFDVFMQMMRDYRLQQLRQCEHK